MCYISLFVVFWMKLKQIHEFRLLFLKLISFLCLWSIRNILTYYQHSIYMLPVIFAVLYYPHSTLSVNIHHSVLCYWLVALKVWSMDPQVSKSSAMSFPTLSLCDAAFSSNIEPKQHITIDWMQQQIWEHRYHLLS